MRGKQQKGRLRRRTLRWCGMCLGWQYLLQKLMAEQRKSFSEVINSVKRGSKDDVLSRNMWDWGVEMKRWLAKNGESATTFGLLVSRKLGKKLRIPKLLDCYGGRNNMIWKKHVDNL